MDHRVTTEVSHLQQLRKASWEHPDPRFTRALREALEQTEHFVFTAIPGTDEEIEASIAAMQEADVWHLPHAICTFEYTALLSVEGRILYGGNAFRVITLCMEKAEGPQVIATFIKPDPKNPRGWVPYRHVAERGESEIAAALPGPGETRIALIPTINEEASSVGNAVSGCLVALSTKGIRRERWCGDKKVLIGRKEPSNTYTRVMIAEALQTGDASPMPGERHKVRLHIRRGHVRQQPHGPGRRYTRTIWIQQQLIGYAEEGRVTHDHYEAYPAEARP